MNSLETGRRPRCLYQPPTLLPICCAGAQPGQHLQHMQQVQAMQQAQQQQQAQQHQAQQAQHMAGGGDPRMAMASAAATAGLGGGGGGGGPYALSPLPPPPLHVAASMGPAFQEQLRYQDAQIAKLAGGILVSCLCIAL